MDDMVFNYWHVLGPLLQREVVKKLNFMDRLELRATSNHEKTLVDSLRKTFTLEYVKLSPGKIKAVDCYGTKMTCRQLTPNALLYVLGGFKIEDFTIYLAENDSLRFTPDHFEFLDRELKKINTKSFKILARAFDGFRDGKFFLAKCGDNLEKVRLIFEDDWTENVDEIFDFESVKNMSGLMFVSGLEPDYEIQTMDLWTGMNLSIGSQLEISKMDERSSIEDVAAHFETRLRKHRKYDEDGQKIIISTNDPTKEVMIVENFYEGTNDWAYRVTVVPANLHKSKYEEYIEKYGDKES